MTQIILTPEQAAVLASTTESIAVCRPDGTVAAIIPWKARFIIPKECPFSPDEIAEADKASESPGPWYTTNELVDRLKSLGPVQP